MFALLAGIRGSGKTDCWNAAAVPGSGMSGSSLDALCLRGYKTCSISYCFLLRLFEASVRGAHREQDIPGTKLSRVEA